jgi:hypothetical protein
VSDNGEARHRGLLATLLTERGIAAVMAVILLLALWQVIGSQQAFQTTMAAEAVRTNEKLGQMQIDHAVLKGQLDRIERSLPGGLP